MISREVLSWVVNSIPESQICSHIPIVGYIYTVIIWIFNKIKRIHHRTFGR